MISTHEIYQDFASFSTNLDLIQSFGHLESEGFLKYFVKISLKRPLGKTTVVAKTFS